MTKKQMTDDERQQLARKLDKDLDEFIGGLQKSKYKDGWTEENWEEEMQKHPFFRSKPLEQGEEIPPLIQGLQELKYSSELHTDEELATLFKEDGNLCFKVKKYRHAVDNYTEGLRKRHANTELITQLLTNRAAAHFHLENFRSSIGDCERALRLTPGHVKAVMRGALCCGRLGRHGDAVQWCDRGLALQPQHQELVKMRHAAAAQQRVEERDRRRAARREKIQAEKDNRLLDALKQRNVRLQDPAGRAVGGGALRVDLLTPQVPGVRAPVALCDRTSALLWPMMFCYPEHQQTELVEAADDTDTLAAHLETMFGPEAPPSEWDPQRRYTPDRLDLFFEADGGHCLVPVDTRASIRSVIADSRYVVKGGVPSFIVLLRDSMFERDFTSRYTVEKT